MPEKSRKSVMVFSMHRSASTLMIDFLKDLAKASNMRHGHIDPMLESAKINLHQPVRHLSPGFAKKLSPVNVIYGPFRRFAEIPDIERFNSVMILRDPRDVLVSLFYAQVYSHGPPPDPKKRADYLKKSKRAKQTGIDATVLEWADNMVRIYTAYMKAQEQHKIPLLTYAKLVTNFKSFLREFLDYCELPEFYNRMLKFDRFKPPKENVYAHKRQITPGDHKRKLKGATVVKLNNKLGRIVSWLRK